MIILPSLEIVPAKYNGNILLSQIPVNGAGDFTVSRALNTATRVNSLGNIELVNADTPRIDYLTSSGTVGCPALLVEPSGQNICLQSEAIGITSWFNTAITVSPNVSATLDPSGGNKAEKIIATAVSGAHFTTRATSTQTGQHTFSVFAKAAEYSFIRLPDLNAGRYNVWYDLVSGTANGAGASIQNYGNGWYRCSVTYDGAGASVANGLVGVPTSGGGVSYTGDGTSGIYVWGAQLETGSIATSYIPTTTAAVTRNADVVSVSGAVSGSIGQTEGVLYIECESNFANDDIIAINRDLSNAITIYKGGSNQVIGRVYASGATFSFASSATTGVMKIALAYKSGDSALFLNGAQVGSTNTTAITFSAALNLISMTKASSYLVGVAPTRIRAAALYQTRLTNTQLSLLTSPYTSYSSMASALSYTLG